VLPSELTAVPWPALLVGANGAVLAASPEAVALLGMSPSDIAALEGRFELLSTSGQPVPSEEHPLRRAARAELFQVGGIWRDRDSARELSLRFRCRAVGPYGLLEIDSLLEDAERRATERLSKLNEALLGRTPGEGFISIRELLFQLVLQACEITGARYGALGVLERDDSSLKDFIYVGVPEDTARAIGHLPVGKGLLGAVISEGHTIRVPQLAADPRSAGFPPAHPPMTSFLGVPLRVGQQVFGNFYLTDKQGGTPFTDDDARLVERFSAQASLTLAYARQAEQEERRLFETVVQHAPHGIVYFPADPGSEVLGTPAAESLLGRITRENDPARTYDLKHPGGRPLAEHDLPSTRALREEAVINLEVVIERHQGRITPALLSAAPVRAESGVRLGAVVIFQDITALKQLQHLRQDFMALVAHDLRTPLQSVLLQIDVLMQRAAGGAASEPVSALQSMKRNSQRLDRLVLDLLDASQVDSHVFISTSKVRLRSLRLPSCRRSQGRSERTRPPLSSPGSPRGLARSVRLEQVVTNLLENAAKYSDEGTEIRILIEPAGPGRRSPSKIMGPASPRRSCHGSSTATSRLSEVARSDAASGSGSSSRRGSSRPTAGRSASRVCPERGAPSGSGSPPRRRRNAVRSWL
jgi:PAS domain S-box-containing protein